MKELRIPIKNWELIAMINEQDGEQFVAVYPICVQLGLDPASQKRKICKDPRYRVCHMTLPSAGGDQKMLCLTVKQLNVWLCTVNAKKVTPEFQEKLMAFQEECAIAIYNHFHGTVNPQVVETLMAMVKDLQSRLDILRTLARRRDHLKLLGEQQ